ncbi:MAG: AEC family transporter [Deltaproteobacteria bacterium]|nr:AEC family transporter [Deltaproteobacteria bacterium]
MRQVVNTIVPVFAVIVLGWVLRTREFFPPQMLASLNRMVYYFAIPAMIFREVAGAEFLLHFNLALLCSSLIPVVIVFFLALFVVKITAVPLSSAGTFVQSAYHGNLGYIGLAVVYYFLGDIGFRSASILAGFLMILQNLLSVLALQWFNEKTNGRHNPWFFIKKIIGNPVVCSALVGIFFSILRIPIPEIINRGLKIVSGMALPLALLIIGASLSFALIRSHFRLVLGAGAFKLVALPLLGLIAYRRLGIPACQFLPGLILLACPTATIAYVMATEMNGSPDLASAAVSTNTLASCLTFILWLGLFA